MFGLGINNPFNLKERERARVQEKDQSAYQKFFAKELKKRGVNSPAELSDADKKKFYDYIDANWKADKESD
tara:strand:+ start:471 stop:683 length:213 start_codon:yes stop_codon:yes gene_type:complete